MEKEELVATKARYVFTKEFADEWDDAPRNTEGVKLCKVDDPQCEACQ